MLPLWVSQFDPERTLTHCGLHFADGHTAEVWRATPEHPLFLQDQLYSSN